LQAEERTLSQADIRRAVSAAYYALFHLLVEAATDLLCPKQPSGLQARFRRAFLHSGMKVVCKQFEAGRILNMSPEMRDLFTEPIEPELLNVAKAFRDLQAIRHSADYDLDTPISGDDAKIQLRKADHAFRDWQAIQTTNNAKAFLTALLLHRHWKRE
jgi:uncharacterized protein (UPF0332 family)